VNASSSAQVDEKQKLESAGSSIEEKKMDSEDLAASETNPGVSERTTLSDGVNTLRNLLNLSASEALPTVENASLPSLGASLSSCELINEEEIQKRIRSDSIADNMTVSSASSGVYYTLSRPYESNVIGARYLTNTNKECATKVSELGDAIQREDKVLVKAMKMYEDSFPLKPIDKPQAQDDKTYDKNGKRVIEMSLSLPDDFTLEYEPGDSVGLIVPNSPTATNFILEMLRKHHNILPSQKISVDANRPITVEEAVRNNIDLCSVMKKKRLFLLSMFASDAEEEKSLRLLCSSDSGKEELFTKYVEDQRRTVIDILKEFPSCQGITLEGLLGCLPAIPPRYYSVCSSPLKERQNGDANHCLKVAFSVVYYLTPLVVEDSSSQRRIGGLATRYLECLCSPFLANQTPSSNPVVKIFPKPTHDFRLPPNLSTPLILIGPGTGIAPFLGFLSHRQAQFASLESTEAAEMASEGTWRGGYELDPEELNITCGDARGLNLAVDYMRKQSVGEIDVFFGCRYSDHDWLYEKELKEFQAAGIVSNLYTAFSREGEDKMYVQTLMKQDKACADRVVQMIMEKQASVYVCGDGNAMGRDVQEAITALLGTKMNELDGAVAYMNQMKSTGRFVLDIWS
jgi:sulfite reductase alpha subunit-like flavoprotein